ncbi:MAG: rhomboid family intramembrane serine protease [Saprospiraceae bacterium]|nr:rhomboid family intramembrane serine protease [Saprospiraceae bacterium]
MSPAVSGAVLNLLILNVLMFVGSYMVLGAETHSADGYESLWRLKLASFMPGSEHFQPWQILTHMFMHGDIMHLAFNMFSLYMFGSMVEMTWGTNRFLFYYLFCGIGAWALFWGIQWWELAREGYDPTTWPAPMLGASGAVYGILVAFAWNFPNQELRLLFPPIAMKAKYFVIIMAALEFFYGVRGTSTGIAHFAHIGGALFGLLLILYWNYGKRR